MISNEIAREDRAPFRKGASLIKRTPTYIKPVRRRMEKKLGSDRKLMFVPLVCWESPVLHGQHLSHGFLLFSPSSAAAPTTTPHLTHPPHWLPRGSPLQEHHVTTLTPASPRPQAGPRTPWACTEGGRRGSSKTRVPRTSKRPEGRVLSVSSKNEEQVSFNLFQFTQLQFRISAVISLHSLIFLCLFFFLSF